MNLAQARRSLGMALMITRREVRDQFRDWRILAPIILLTLFFPLLMNFTAGQAVGFVAQYGADVIGDRLIPFLLMIVGFFPISISLVIALESFVGEKERHSLEPLLSSPLTDVELYVGKTLAAMLPPLLAAYLGITVYLVALAVTIHWYPNPILLIQILALTTIQALVMVAGAVVISAQTTSVRAANLLASFIIIPMALLVQGESLIMFWAEYGALWWVIFGLAVITVILIRIGVQLFNREELLGRQIDSIDLRRWFRRVGRQVRAAGARGLPAPSLWGWYRHSVPASLGRQKSAIVVTALAFLAALAAGVVIGLQPQWRLPLPQGVDLTHAAGGVGDASALVFGSGGALSIVMQNWRILALATLLAVFSFGSMALVITPMVYLIIGYIMTQFALAGYNPALLVPALAVHGIVEIPVILIAAACALKLGAVITRPPKGQTVGQAWTVAFSDAVKLWLGIILPGLVLAALIEAYVTPVVVTALLGG